MNPYDEHAYLLSLETEEEIAFLGIFTDFTKLCQITECHEWIIKDQGYMLPAHDDDSLQYTVRVLPLNGILGLEADFGA